MSEETRKYYIVQSFAPPTRRTSYTLSWILKDERLDGQYVVGIFDYPDGDKYLQVICKDINTAKIIGNILNANKDVCKWGYEYPIEIEFEKETMEEVFSEVYDG